MSWTENIYEPIPDGEYAAVVSTIEIGFGQAEFSPHLKVRYELVGSGRIVFGFVPIPHWCMDSTEADYKNRVEFVTHWLNDIGHKLVQLPDDEDEWEHVIQEIEFKKTPLFLRVGCQEWQGRVLTKIRGIRKRT